MLVAARHLSLRLLRTWSDVRGVPSGARPRACTERLPYGLLVAGGVVSGDLTAQRASHVPRLATLVNMGNALSRVLSKYSLPPYTSKEQAEASEENQIELSHLLKVCGVYRGVAVVWPTPVTSCAAATCHGVAAGRTRVRCGLLCHRQGVHVPVQRLSVLPAPVPG